MQGDGPGFTSSLSGREHHGGFWPRPAQGAKGRAPGAHCAAELPAAVALGRGGDRTASGILALPADPSAFLSTLRARAGSSQNLPQTHSKGPVSVTCTGALSRLQPRILPWDRASQARWALQIHMGITTCEPLPRATQLHRPDPCVDGRASPADVATASQGVESPR